MFGPVRDFSFTRLSVGNHPNNDSVVGHIIGYFAVSIICIKERL